MKKKLILIGPPGCGKGTQSLKLKDKYGFAHVSSGDVLRGEVARGSDFGKKIKHFMDKGEIGPVELITDVILNFVDKECGEHFLLDGFPRALYQAEELSKRHEIDFAIFIDVSENAIVSRITGRRNCPDCKTIYHTVFNSPVKEGICDKCGAGLMQRSDDNEETALNRIRVYNNDTKPILDYYKKNNKLVIVNGEGDPEKIFFEIENHLV